jgi:hypothetical protein
MVSDSTNIVWESVYKISQLGGHADFYVLWFGVVYAISRWIRQRNCECALNFVQISEKCYRGPDNDESSVRGRKLEPYMESPNSPETEKRRDSWRAESRAFSSFYLTTRRLFTNNSSGQAKQSTSPRTLETTELAVASPQLTVSHLISHRGISDREQYDCRPPPTLLAWLTFLSFPDWR